MVPREALHLLRDGADDAGTIGRVTKGSLDRRYAATGPLEGAGLGGLDTFLAAHLMPELARGEAVPEALAEHTGRGERGRGPSFHAWDAAREDRLRRVRLAMPATGACCQRPSTRRHSAVDERDGAPQPVRRTPSAGRGRTPPV